MKPNIPKLYWVSRWQADPGLRSSTQPTSNSLRFTGFERYYNPTTRAIY
ncbi:hypothetical protein [Anabaena sp. CCY 9402-a]